VWAGMRQTSSRKWLQNEWLQFVTLDLADSQRLGEQLAGFKAKHGKWDYVVHAAGATKCRDAADFDRNNFDCTVNLVEALRRLDMAPRLFVYVSSLSVLGPIREPYKDFNQKDRNGRFVEQFPPLKAADTPEPNTAYGRSKRRSEEFLQSLDYLFPYVVMRPTGVYGPREKDYFLMAKSIKRHVDFAVGLKPQMLTFVYVKDLAGAIFAAIQKSIDGEGAAIEHKIYHVSDGRLYPSRAFSDYIQQDLGVRRVVHVKAPLWLLRAVCAVAEWWAGLWKKASTLNGDKYRIMKQRNWNCDIEPMRQELGYEPQWDLERGTRETMAWYVENNWL